MGRSNRVVWATKMTGRLVLYPFFRTERFGLENLPRGSAFILLPKHQRWEDIPLLSLATPRDLYYVAKHELFTTRFTHWFIRSLGGIPLNRDRPLQSRRSLKAVIEYLKQGEGVVVFPEGTYFVNEMGPGNVGMVRLILSRLTLPFVPVGIRYTREGWRTRVRIKFGEAFYGESMDSPKTFVEFMMGQIAELSGLPPREEAVIQRAGGRRRSVSGTRQAVSNPSSGRQNI
jgi:1-acyl-sn-glycerol-3-phosphate acyltransferase